LHCRTSWNSVYVLGHPTETDTSNETANAPKKFALKINDSSITFASWKIKWILKILIDYNEQNLLLRRKGKMDFPNKTKQKM